MNLIENCVDKLSKLDNKIKIAFVEGNSCRMIKAAKELKAKNVLEPIMIFETTKSFEENKNDLDGFETFIIDQREGEIKELAKKYQELRNGKEDFAQSLANLQKAEFVAAMLMQSGKVDGALGGVHLPTSKILKAAFKTLGSKEGIKTISSIMIMAKDKETYLFGDISVNPDPDAHQLADIAQNANEFAKGFDIDQKLAFLSFSTSGSASNHQTQKVIEATKEYNLRKISQYDAIGEVQFDAAFVDSIKDQKYKYDYGFKGTAKIFIFPDLNAGNIGYKIAQRMGNWSAMGPIITGLKKPYNDLSRGSTVQNIVDSAIVTAMQALNAQGE